MAHLEPIAKSSGLRLFVVGPDSEAVASMTSQILSASEGLVSKGYRLRVTPFVLTGAGKKELRIHYY